MPDDEPPDADTGLGCWLLFCWGLFAAGFCAGLELGMSVYQGHW